MGKTVFSKESLDKISSPEKLDDYLKVTSPAVWMILGSIIVLLIGAVVWGIFGRMDSYVNTCAVAKNGQVVCYVGEENISRIVIGQEIEIDGENYKVTNISSMPVQVNDNFSDYEKHMGGFTDGEWVYEILTDANMDSGVKNALIITESISPISFILN